MVNELLATLQVFLDRDQAKDFDNWFRVNATQEKTPQGAVELMVDAIDIFKQMGVTNSTMQKKTVKETKTRLLSDEVLMQCHLLCL